MYQTPAPVLRDMLRSVLRQSFGDWELCVVDDASPDLGVRRIVESVAAIDPRVKLGVREVNGGIVDASNDALAMATGEFVALLDHDDKLHPDALRMVDAAIGDDHTVDYVYTDEDKIDEKGRHAGPFLKPDWSPDRFRTQMYTCHLSVLRRSLVEEVGGFDAEFEGAQDWDLVLRVTERARTVRHVPRVLYHWRGIEGSTAAAPEEGGGEAAKPWAFEAGTRAIQAHCDRTGVEARAVRDAEDLGVYHLEPALRSNPAVSIVIPTNGQRREIRYQEVTLVEHCVRSIITDSTYPNYEVVVVVDSATPKATISALQDIAGDRLVLVPFDRTFNFAAKINAGAVRASGEHLVLLNDDIEVSTDDWMERMVMYSSVPEIGAVGGRLLLEDGRLQHGGVAFEGGLPGHPYYGWPGDAPGYANSLKVARNLLAVTGACLMTPRDVFDEVGGLAVTYPINYNDVDYCLKVRECGRRVVYDPDLVMHHFESSSRSSDVADWEKEKLLERWRGATDPDPYSNPYLHREMPTLVAAFAWARRSPRLRLRAGRI
ncbi:MAG: glycosyltransferase [Actinobacteria bacterium]|nr:glycosyltransferase [Actinomycetota bacterium]